MWTSSTIALGLALAVILAETFALRSSRWVHDHAAKGTRLEHWAEGIAELARSLLPQFIMLSTMLALIAVFSYFFADGQSVAWLAVG